MEVWRTSEGFRCGINILEQFGEMLEETVTYADAGSGAVDEYNDEEEDGPASRALAVDVC